MFVMEFFKDDVADSHSQCRIGSLFGMYPPIRVFRDFAIIRTDIHERLPRSRIDEHYGQELLREDGGDD